MRAHREFVLTLLFVVAGMALTWWWIGPTPSFAKRYSCSLSVTPR